MGWDGMGWDGTAGRASGTAAGCCTVVVRQGRAGQGRWWVVVGGLGWVWVGLLARKEVGGRAGWQELESWELGEELGGKSRQGREAEMWRAAHTHAHAHALAHDTDKLLVAR